MRARLGAGTLVLALLGMVSVRALADADEALVARGASLFVTPFTTAQGLGPLFNSATCVTCHVAPSIGGMGPDGVGTATRVGRLTPSGFDALVGRGGPVARSNSVSEWVRTDRSRAFRRTPTSSPFATHQVFTASGSSTRSPRLRSHPAPSRSDGVYVAASVAPTARSRSVASGGRQSRDRPATVANAMRNEIGITNPLAPMDLPPVDTPGHERCAGEGGPRGRRQHRQCAYRVHHQPAAIACRTDIRRRRYNIRRHRLRPVSRAELGVAGGSRVLCWTCCCTTSGRTSTTRSCKAGHRPRLANDAAVGLSARRAFSMTDAPPPSPRPSRLGGEAARTPALSGASAGGTQGVAAFLANFKARSPRVRAHA